MKKMPELLDEWAFRFMLYGRSGSSVPCEAADELLLSVITPWAEDHGWGIGGGFRAPAGDKWHYNFGLCLNVSDEWIPHEKAQELMQVIRSWAKERSYIVRGGFRPFDERDDIAFEADMKRWLSDDTDE